MDVSASIHVSRNYMNIFYMAASTRSMMEEMLLSSWLNIEKAHKMETMTQSILFQYRTETSVFAKTSQ